MSRRTRPVASPARGLLVTGAIWFAAWACLILLSIAFVDRPVSRFVHDELRHGPVATALARLPETMTLVPLLALGTAVAALVAGARVGPVLRLCVLAMASFLVGEGIKSSLKLAFGRTWPETWVYGNVSFIRDGVYGFFPFHGGPAYAAFPSGHMTAASAVMTVAWLVIPRFRPLWGLVMAGAAVGLLAMNYHFVGDVMAGFCLGAAVAVAVVRLARARLPFLLP